MRDDSIMNKAVEKGGKEGTLFGELDIIRDAAIEIFRRVQGIVVDYHPNDRPLVLAVIADYMDRMLAAVPQSELELCRHLTMLLKLSMGSRTIKTPAAPPSNPIPRDDTDKEDKDND